MKKMLQVVPDHLEQVAISIEILLDMNDLTVEEVTGRLRNVEQLRNKEKAEKAHVAQSEEDEPALFMVSAYVPNFDSNCDSKSTEVEV